MSVDVFVATFDAVRAYIDQPCPTCALHFWPADMDCPRCGGAGEGRVPTLTTLTLPDPPPMSTHRRFSGLVSDPRPLPLTLGLVVPSEWDQGAAARIEADHEGWMFIRPGPDGRPAVLIDWSTVPHAPHVVVLPVGHLVATARVTDVEPVVDPADPRIGGVVVVCPYCDTERWFGVGPCGTCNRPPGYVWHVSGVAVVDPSPVDIPADRTVWVP